MIACSNLTEWRPNVFLHEEPISVYGMTVSRRMTIIRLSSGKLWVHSPNSLTAELKEQLATIGDVAYIISPNKMHQKALEDYQICFPAAQLFLPSGFPEMRPDLDYHSLLGPNAPSEWRDEIQQTVVRGNIFHGGCILSPTESLTSSNRSDRESRTGAYNWSLEMGIKGIWRLWGAYRSTRTQDVYSEFESILV